MPFRSIRRYPVLRYSLAVAVVIWLSSSSCTCSNNVGDDVDAGGNGLTCVCTCDFSSAGTCASGCADVGSSTCPTTITAGGRTVTNCLTLSPKMCLPAERNPHFGNTAPSADGFCENVCNDWGGKLINLLGNPCVLGLSPECHGVAVVPDGGPAIQNFGPTCDQACPTVSCTTDAIDAGAGLPLRLAVCASEDGGVAPGALPACCTQVSTCGTNSRVICAPDTDPEGLFAWIFRHENRGSVDGTSTVTISSGDAGTTVPVRGSVTFVGRACSSNPCNVGMGFQLFVERANLNGVSISDVSVVGGTMTPGSIMLIDGTGAPAGSDLTVTVEATGSGCLLSLPVVGCVIPVSGRAARHLVPNAPDQPTVHVAFALRTFTLSGSFHSEGSPDDGIGPFDVALSIHGSINNVALTANAGPDQSVECQRPEGASVVLDAGATFDPENQIITYSWHSRDPLFGPFLGDSPAISVVAPKGTTTYGVTVFDMGGQGDQATTHVTVVDSTAPSFDSVDVEPPCLWSPSHRMVLLRLGAEIRPTLSDACDGTATAIIESVTASQGPLDHGSGQTAPDVLFGTRAACVRAERNGPGKAGRVYTITLRATDSAGNTSRRSTQVVVPHDQGGSKCQKTDSALLVDDDDPRCLEGGPPPPLADAGASMSAQGSAGGQSASGCASAAQLPLVALTALLIARRRRESRSGC